MTLEPCNHQGRTPPCSEALIKAGVARVVYAIGDPNPLVKGGGAQRLREAGVQVQSGLLEREATELNAGFIKRMRAGLPLVRVKLAMSLDGRTALSDGRSKWITRRGRAPGCAALARAQRGDSHRHRHRPGR